MKFPSEQHTRVCASPRNLQSSVPRTLHVGHYTWVYACFVPKPTKTKSLLLSNASTIHLFKPQVGIRIRTAAGCSRDLAPKHRGLIERSNPARIPQLSRSTAEDGRRKGETWSRNLSLYLRPRRSDRAPAGLHLRTRGVREG